MLIKVRVFAGSRKADIFEKSKDSFEVRAKEKAERGTANRAVIRALALHFKIPVSHVRLIKGAYKPNKIFDIK